MLLNIEVPGNYLSFCPRCEQLLLQKVLSNYLRRAKRGKAGFELEKPKEAELLHPLPEKTMEESLDEEDI